MPIKRILTSSKSGRLIPDGQHARIRITYLDVNGKTERRPARRCDLTDREVEQLLPFAEQVESRPNRRRSRVEL